MFNDLFGSDLDLYVGQFQISDPLFKREVRLPFEDYQIYRATPGDSRINLTYDRGVMLTYGFATGTDVTFEVLNGTGIDEANIFRNFDDDPYKNVLLRVSQEIAPAFRVGALRLHRARSGRRRSSIRSGWPAATRRSRSSRSSSTSSTSSGATPIPSSRPILPIEKLRTRGAFAELIYLPKGDDSRWYAAGLFNWVDSDQTELRYTAATAHVGYLLRRNMRLTAEATYAFRGPYAKHVRVGTGLVLGF